MHSILRARSKYAYELLRTARTTKNRYNIREYTTKVHIISKLSMRIA